MLLESNGSALQNASSFSLSTISTSSIGEVTNISNSSTSLGIGNQLRLAWNYLRFGWAFTLPASFSPGVPIYFLGRRYVDLKHGELKTIRSGCLDGDIEAFMDDFRSRIWFTYRDEFPPIPLFSPALFQNIHAAQCLNSPSSNSTPSGNVDNSLKSTAEFRHRLSSTSARLLRQVNPGRSSRNDLSREVTPPLKIPLSTRTSDCGWGCMLRSGQMLVAQALVTHFLGRDWIYPRDTGTGRRDPTARMHRQIVRWFADTPESPLSIHRLLQASGNPPGTWFGPASICCSLVIAMAIAGQKDSLLSEIEIYLARDRVICSEEVVDLFNHGYHPSSVVIGDYSLTDHTGNYKDAIKVKKTPMNSDNSSYNSQPSSTVNCGDGFVVVSRGGSSNSVLLVDENTKMGIKQQPRHPAATPRSQPKSVDLDSAIDGFGRRGLILLVPMRLGVGSRIDPVYIPTLLHLLRDPSCVGLIGGRPKHSVYAAGSQADRLIFYDPHFCQDSVGIEHKCFNLNSWHCTSPRVMRAKRLDPSCAFGFYCGSRMELDQLLKRLPSLSEIRSSNPQRTRSHLIEVVSASEASHLFSSPAVHSRYQTTRTSCISSVDNVP